MKVIVAGFPKTGTKSMNAALTKLGYKVYDSPENAYLLEKEWTKIMSEGWMTEDFKRMYENVDAVTDIPAAYFWEEIHKAFPEAKIILSVRDDEEVWVESMINQMEVGRRMARFRIAALLSPTHRRITRNITKPTAAIVMGTANLESLFSKRSKPNKELLKLKYRSHNAYVKQSAPADKLLIFKCSDGWEPLCKFLGKPVPDEPFSHKNVKGGALKDLVATHPLLQKMNKEIKFSLSIIGIGVASLSLYVIYLRAGGIRSFFACFWNK